MSFDQWFNEQIPLLNDTDQQLLDLREEIRIAYKQVWDKSPALCIVMSNRVQHKQ